MHGHPTVNELGWVLFGCLSVLVLVTAAVGYAVALRLARRRGPWPVYRSVLWYTGLVCVGIGFTGPTALAAHSSFTAHMWTHLLVGMAAPLLLVLAAPITVTLRALPVSSARALTRILRSSGILFLTHPVIAAALNIGGLWLLYTTALYQLIHSSALIYGLVHAHILVAGYFFTASVVGVDPNPHRTSMALRSTVLIVFIAVHSILAKWLYAHPPAGVSVSDARAGAQLMYYGGDVVDLTLIIVLFMGWYTATRPRDSRVRDAGRPSAR